MDLLSDPGHAMGKLLWIGHQRSIGSPVFRHPTVVDGNSVVPLFGQSGAYQGPRLRKNNGFADVALIIGPVVVTHGRSQRQAIPGGRRVAGQRHSRPKRVSAEHQAERQATDHNKVSHVRTKHTFSSMPTISWG